MKILTNTRAVLTGLAVAGIATAGLTLGAAPANAAPTGVWDRVAACESGGNWHIDTGNGYYGGLQFSMATWRGYGGTGSPANASKSTQIAIAEKVLAGQGWGAWPVCSVKAGATGSSSSARAVAPKATHRSSSSSSSTTTRHYSAPVTSNREQVSQTQAAPSRPAPVKTSGKTYSVKSGDSLSKITKKLHVKGGWTRLWAANRTISDPDLILVGQKLQLPA